MTLVFGAAVADRVQKLAAFYGEGTPEAIIARAIGVMEAIEPFVHEGVLTVIDPNRPGDDPAD